MLILKWEPEKYTMQYKVPVTFEPGTNKIRNWEQTELVTRSNRTSNSEQIGQGTAYKNT